MMKRDGKARMAAGDCRHPHCTQLQPQPTRSHAVGIGSCVALPHTAVGLQAVYLLQAPLVGSELRISCGGGGGQRQRWWKEDGRYGCCRSAH